LCPLDRFNLKFLRFKKKFEEQVSIFGDDQIADVNLDQLSKMKYLEACIKEGLVWQQSKALFNY